MNKHNLHLSALVITLLAGTLTTSNITAGTRHKIAELGKDTLINPNDNEVSLLIDLAFHEGLTYLINQKTDNESILQELAQSAKSSTRYNFGAACINLLTGSKFTLPNGRLIKVYYMGLDAVAKRYDSKITAYTQRLTPESIQNNRYIQKISPYMHNAVLYGMAFGAAKGTQAAYNSKKNPFGKK